MGDGLLALGAHRGDLALEQSLFERSGRAAGCFDLLEQRPRRAAEFFRQVFEAAGASRRIGDLGEVGFLEQDQLRIARNAPREAIGQAERLGERQDR